MKKYLLLLVLTFIILPGCSDNTVKLYIVVITENLPDSSKIFITGNDEQLGNWQPDLIELERNDDNTWTKSFSFEKGKKLEFKITRGSWENEALNPDGSVPENHYFELLNDSTITIEVLNWLDQIDRKVEGQITGEVKYHRNFQGEGIKARDIIVWLPPGYDSDKPRRYSVLYMHDGQNIIDPSTSTFLVDWQLDEAADTLIKKGIYRTNSNCRNIQYD